MSCNSKSQEDSLKFDIDYNSLGEKYSSDSLNLTFFLPAGWNIDKSKPLPGQTQKFPGTELDSYSLKIKEIFYDSLSSSFCSVSKIQANDSLKIKSLLNSYETIFTRQFGSENVKRGHFSIGEMEINQFLLMTNTYVLFKLNFMTDKNFILQLDYAIDRSIYPGYIKKIESSIGSIATL